MEITFLKTNTKLKTLNKNISCRRLKVKGISPWARSWRGCRVGLRRRSRKAVLPKGDVGSNPTLSAIDITEGNVKLRCVGMRTSPVFFTGDSSATEGRRSERSERAHPTLSAILRQGFGWQAILFSQRSFMRKRSWPLKLRLASH